MLRACASENDSGLVIRDAVNTGLGIEFCRSTVANILNEAGIVPAPEREKQRTWKQFMHAHWESLYACDFFAVETLGVFGAVRHMVFFVVKLETRRTPQLLLSRGGVGRIGEILDTTPYTVSNERPMTVS